MRCADSRVADGAGRTSTRRRYRCTRCAGGITTYEVALDVGDALLVRRGGEGVGCGRGTGALVRELLPDGPGRWREVAPDDLAHQARALLARAAMVPPAERWRALIEAGLIDEDGRVLLAEDD